MENSSNKLFLKFTGENLQEGVIGLYDLSSTIIALGSTIDAISNLSGYTKDQKLKIDVSALRPGSFEVEIIVNFENIKTAVDIAVAATMLSPGVIDSAKNVLLILKDLISLKKFLKGEKPSDMKIDVGGLNPTVTVYNIHGDNMQISIPVYNAVQDKNVNKSIQGIYKPLSNEDSNIDAIELKMDKKEGDGIEEVGSVAKEDMSYFEDISELQSMKDYKVKAIVSRLDSKTGKGFLTIGNKRVNFELGGIHPAKYQETFIILAESLKLKMPILITGNATLDFESNLKRIIITSVESEAKLF